MVKTRQSAVYNSRILYMLSTRSSCVRAALVVLILWCHGVAWAGEWDATEQQLAAKIVAVAGAGPAAIEVGNRSSLGQTEVETIRRELMVHLAALGLKLSSAAPASISIEVSLSENIQKYVWVAEIRKGSDAPAIVMVETSRAVTSGTVRETPAISVHKVLLSASDSQILDAAVINGALPRMVVLYPGQIQFFRMQGDHWVVEQAFPVNHARPWPRDLRGRLVLRSDRSVEAHLPGVICDSNAVGALSVSCSESDDPWPIGTSQSALNAFFAPSRNFFTGVLSPGNGKQSPPFYSAAAIANDHGTTWLIAAVDGHVHLLDGVSDVIAGKLSWGSDIAAVHSPCGSRWQILVTSNEMGQDDAVRAYEVPGREPVAVSQVVVLSGGVTALWTAPDENGAVAVAHNAETGKYEAYLLTMACGQ